MRAVDAARMHRGRRVDRSSAAAPSARRRGESGSGHSQRSSRVEAERDRRAERVGPTLASVSSTGCGAPVVPEVWTTSARSSASARLGRAAAGRRRGARREPRRSRSGQQPRVDRQRRAPSSRHACSAHREVEARRQRDRDAVAAAHAARGSAAARARAPAARAYVSRRRRAPRRRRARAAGAAARSSHGSRPSTRRLVSTRRDRHLDRRRRLRGHPLRDSSGDGIAKITIDRPGGAQRVPAADDRRDLRRARARARGHRRSA